MWLASRSLERLEGLACELGQRAHAVRLDVSDVNTCAETVVRLDTSCGGFDLVIANAGIGENRPSLATDWPWTRDVLMTNFVGAAATLSSLVPAMAERGRGHLVGIGSLSSHVEAVGAACYAGSKAGLSHYLKSLRPELVAAGLDVTVIEPGFIRTPMTDGNRMGMPFLLDADVAVRRMITAIDRRVPLYRFPRRTHWLIRAFNLLPSAVRSRIALRTVQEQPEPQP